MDHRPGHNYRLPGCQKRSTGRENYLSTSRTRSQSPHRTVFVAQRRHSTPPASARLLIEIKPQSKPAKNYYPNRRRLRLHKERKIPNDPYKSRLTKRFQQNKHVNRNKKEIDSNKTYVTSTPETSRYRTTETSNSTTPEMLSFDTDESIIRKKSTQLNLGNQVSIPNDDIYIENISQTKLKQHSKERCCSLFSICNLCQLYRRCPLCCCMTFLIFIVTLFVVICVSIGILSSVL